MRKKEKRLDLKKLPPNKRVKLAQKTNHGLKLPVTEKTSESKDPFIMRGKKDVRKYRR